MKDHYDVIVFGAGPAGTAAAFGLVKSKSVLVIENDLFGGTCPNRGCDPKKMLYLAVEAQDRVARMQGSGLKSVPTIDWPQLMTFKRGYTSQIPGGTQRGLENGGIDTYHGDAAFIDDHQIQVGDQVVSAETFIIATGRKPRLMDIPGKEFLKTSNDFLDLDELPKQITFVGAGPVAMELANIANKAGADVRVIHHNDRPLKHYPEKFVELLVKQMTDEGIHFDFNDEVEAVTQLADGYQVTTHTGEFETDYVVAAVGRDANISMLQLENGGVKATPKGITVDDHLKTTNDNIYAIGDVVAKSAPKLTPVASFEGRYVAQLLSGQTTSPIHYPVIPEILFGATEIGVVGVNEQRATSEPDRYAISSLDLTHWYTYNRIKENTARVLVIREKQTKRIVGFSMVSSISEHLLNVFNLILNLNLTNDRLQQMIFAYPSISSDLQYLV